MFARVFEAVMFGLEISAAEYTMDTFIVISGRTQFSKILLTVERCIDLNGALSLDIDNKFSANLCREGTP